MTVGDKPGTNRRIRVLTLDTSRAGTPPGSPVYGDIVGYSALSDVPRWVRSTEQRLRLDFSLARLGRTLAPRYDLILAGSEKVGIPLALMKPAVPVMCAVHSVASPWMRAMLRAVGAPSVWTLIGYACEADGRVMATAFGVAPHRLLRNQSAPLGDFTPCSATEGRYLLSVGASKRDFATLGKALRGLHHVAARLYVGSRYQDPYLGELPSAVETIEIVHGAAPERMPEVYADARFVVIPLVETYQYSAGSTVALEALAAGKAIIATRTPGMTDFVIDGVTGVLVPRGDAAALRAAVVRLWDDPRLADEMGRAGRAHAEQAFDPAVIDERILQAYADACDAR
jgi:glycosyltransferase involved in cell wall biosynthesis